MNEMNDNNQQRQDNAPQHEVAPVSEQKLARRRLITMISGSIGVALLLVGISMSLYNTSGTALLDLSVPGLQAAQTKVRESIDDTGFSPTGTIDSETMKAFRTMYDDHTKPLLQSQAFREDPVTDKALGIDAPSKTD